MSTADKAFPIVNETILAEGISLISWCPTTDLVLLVSLSNALLLYRNGVDLVWILKNRFKSTIKVTTWNPNGKEFVVGCEDGTVHRVDIRHQSPTTTTCWNNSEERGEKGVSISSLLWIDYYYSKNQMNIEWFDNNAFDFDTMLPSLSNDPPVEPFSRSYIPRNKRTSLPNKPVKSSDTQTLLLIGNDDGHVHILLSGIYPICHIELDGFDKNALMIDISAAYNTACLQILTKASEGVYEMYTIDTKFLKERKEDVFNISERQAQLNYLLEYVQYSTEVLKKHYDSYSSFSRKIAREAVESIANQDEQAAAMPEVELIGMLATGKVTEPLHEFMSNFLTPEKIKEWENSTMHGCQYSLKTACQYILPASDKIQLELSKLLGYSLWTERYGDFLEINSVESCIDCIQEFVKEVIAFTKSLNSLIKAFSAFIKWILDVSKRISDPESIDTGTQFGLCEEPSLVFEYLDSCFIKDSIAEYFVPVESKKNLIKKLNDLSLCCKDMLKKPSQIFSNKTRVASGTSFTLKSISLGSQVRKTVSPAKEGSNQYIIYAMPQAGHESKLTLLRKSLQSQNVEFASLLFHKHIADFEFFDSNELVILAEDEEKTVLHTVLLETLEFKASANCLLVPQVLQPHRSQVLEDMLKTKIECNGREKRRIFCITASNGYFRTFSMGNEQKGIQEEKDK